ncbi:MAG: exo-alpha-sialidase [Prevotella sp.]|nr:exo-alpha-sialidase [Candidatus Equicola stercoris]
MNTKRISRVLLALFCASNTLVYSQSAPFKIIDGLFNQNDKNMLGLEYAPGLENIYVFSPSDTTDHFVNGVVMASFKGKLYCTWQSSAITEDTPDTWVAYAVSEDDGITWSKPKVLCPTIDDGYCSSGGWLVTQDKLVGYINTWPTPKNESKWGYTRYVESTDGEHWTEPQDVMMADGNRLEGIFEQDPHKLADGRIIGAAHFHYGPVTGQKGIYIQPIYTDDPSGVRGWKRGNFIPTTNGGQSRELEPSVYVKNDGTLVMIFRDQKGTYYKMGASSTDNGENWTKAYLSNMPDSKSKQCAGNLPDGTCFIVNNPVNSSNRFPLAISLSKDGTTFTKAFMLRSTNELPTKKYTDCKGVGYAYPKAMIDGDWLYVGYSQNKEDVMFTRVPLQSLMLTSSIEDIHTSSHISNNNDSFYNLNGQRLNTNNSIPNGFKGIVVKNNKKYILTK